MRDLDQVRYIKDEEGKVLVTKQDIKERQRSYFHKLFSEGHETLLQSDRLKMKEEDQNFTFYHRIQEFEVKEALKQIENGKAVGPDNIHIEVWQCLGGKGISWLTKLFNEILGQRRCWMSGERVSQSLFTKTRGIYKTVQIIEGLS